MPIPLKWVSGQVISGADWNDARLYQPAEYVVFNENSIYYAKGCYSGSTDYSGSACATVVQDAINALDAKGGKIYFMAGTYTFNTGVVISGAGLCLEGAGTGYNTNVGSRLVYNGNASGDLIKYTNTTHKFFGSIKDLELAGSSIAHANGIHVEKMFSDLWFDKLFIWGFSGSAIKLEAASGSVATPKIWNIWILDCLEEVCTNGIYMTNTTDWTYSFIDRITIRGGHFSGNKHSVRIDAGWVSNVLIDGVSSEQDSEEILYLLGGRKLTIVNNRFFDGSWTQTGSYDAIFISGSPASTAPPYFHIIANNTIGTHLIKNITFRYAFNLQGVIGKTLIYNNMLETDTGAGGTWGGIVTSSGIYHGAFGPITFFGNQGYMTENSGYQTLTAASGSFDTKLGRTPLVVFLTPSGSYAGSLRWSMSGSSTSTIWVAQTGSGTAGFYWKAESNYIDAF